MAVVPANTVNASYQKVYTATTLIANQSINQTNLPQVKEVFPYETGGITVASPTTFSEQKTYPPNSLFVVQPISKIGLPQTKEIYDEKAMVESYQILYSPNSLREINGKQSYTYAVTGLNFQTVTVTTIEFWS